MRKPCATVGLTRFNGTLCGPPSTVALSHSDALLDDAALVLDGATRS
jgi:hypothetical protein